MNHLASELSFCKTILSSTHGVLDILANFEPHFHCHCWMLSIFLTDASGESMENALRACCKGIKIGKILIHREGDNGQQVCASLSVSVCACVSFPWF